MNQPSPLTIPIHPEQRELKPGDIFDPRFDVSMNLQQRLHLMMTRLDYIQKQKPKSADQLAPGEKPMRYSIVTHDAVTANVRQHAVACGVLIYPTDVDLKITGNMSIVTMKVIFQSRDDASDIIEVASCGNGIDPGDKGPGKAMSYAFKYALLKALMLETGDDPDTDQDVELLTDAELQLIEQIRGLNRIVQDQPEVVVDALVKDGTLHKDVQRVAAEGSKRAPELRAQVSALARGVNVNLREAWA